MKISKLAKNMCIKLDKGIIDGEILNFELNDQPDNFYCSGKIIAYLRVRVNKGEGLNLGDEWPWLLVNDEGVMKLFPTPYQS